MPTEQNLRNAERSWLQEPSFDGEECDTELTDEQRYRQLADSYLEDPVGFVDELFGKETDQDIEQALQDNYDLYDLSRAVVTLFKEAVENVAEIKRLKELSKITNP